MKMEFESDVHPENNDSKLTSSSPSTHSEMSTDGDNTMFTQPVSQPKTNHTIDETSSSFEPKIKKRRKQSKPLKCQNIASSNEAEFEVTFPEDLSPTDPGKTSETGKNTAVKQEETTIGEITITKLNEYDYNNFESIIPENVSYKNILSHMNSIYGNSKGVGSDFSFSVGHNKRKSDEQSSEADAKNDDVPLNLESSKNMPFYPQMPPLLPLNQTDIVGEISKLSNVFSHLADLPTQLQPNFGVTQSNRSFVTSNGVRVFNPEAYCELCEKEFCNKYFLKTHKANKHGVCSVDTPTTPQRVQPKGVLSLVPFGSLTPENSPHSTSDAYCNICQKSFCNKYFLKKHRQNIHGIIENGTDSPATAQSSIHVPVISSSSSRSNLGGELKKKRSEDTSEEASSDHSGSEDQKNSAIINSLKSKINGNTVPILNGRNPSLSSKSKGQVSSKNSKESKNERFLCTLCNIEFCDKHYLDTHKQNKHGVEFPSKTNWNFADFSEIGKIEPEEKLVIDDRPEDSKGQTCVPCMKNFRNSETFHTHMLDVHGAAIKDETDPAQGQSDDSIKNHALPDSESNDSSNDSGSFFCNLCFMKFKDRSTLLLHFESCHSAVGIPNGTLDKKESFGSSLLALCAASNFSCDACSETFQEKSLLAAHRLKVHGIISAVPEPSFPIQPDTSTVRGIVSDYSYFFSEKQRNPSNQSFCRICNKELCNKYFMKTHMLKMHGIDVESLQSERSSTSSKPSSGAACDICQKVLSNKHFLKIHKLNAHGISDETRMHNSSPEASLNMANSENSSSSKITDQRSILNLATATGINDINNLLYANHQNTSDTNKDYSFSCDICGQLFQSKILLQVHLVNKHINNNESKIADLSSLITLANSESLEIIPKVNGNSVEQIKISETPCSCCSYIHIEDKPKGNPHAQVNDRMLLCHICNSSYSLSEHIQHHLAHNKLLPPDLMSSPSLRIRESNKTATGSENSAKSKQRKFKRFRCSKCDKTFRTRNKCLHHIHVMHKNKREHNNSLTDTQMQRVGFKQSSEPTQISIPGDVHAADTSSKTGSAEGSPEVEEKNGIPASTFQQSTTPLAVPYVMPKSSQDIIMQPFHLTEPKTDGVSKPNVFVPSLVYLPVSKKVSEPITVAFTLTPA